MANTPGTLEQIAIGLGRALTGVTRRLSDAELRDTIARLGLVVPPELLTQPAVVTARNALVTSATALPTTIDALIAAAAAEDLAGIVQQGQALLTQINALIAAFETLPAAIDAVRAAFPEISDAAFGEFAAGFARKLLDLVIADTLDDIPGVGPSLALAGLLERVTPFEATSLDLLDVERTTIRYDRITRLFGAPADHFLDVYDWGSPAFDGLKLLPAISDFLARIGLPAAFHPPTESSPTLLEAYVLDVTPDATLNPPGVDLSIVAPFGATIDQPLSFSNPRWSGRFSANGVFGTVLTGTLRPPLSIGFVSPTATFEGSAELKLHGEGAQPLVLLGTAGGNRVEVKTIEFGTGITFSATTGSAGAEPFLEARLEGGRIVVDGSQGDGFISKVLSGVHIDSTFDVGLEWSMSTGVRFDGSASLSILLPVHVDLGPFTVSEVVLTAGLDADAIPVEISTSLACRLGPIEASISRIGFTATIAFPGTGGNAGPAHVDFAFKFPTAIGLAVDVAGVTGGGFLDIDRPNHRYAGMLQLQFQNTIDVTAIALINTTLPDSREGFSLVIVISAEFQPIQLGLGFTLNGIGGLLALNRTVDVEVVRQGLRTNALSSILFPHDPIANAPRIISDIAAIFPPLERRFVIGPMAKIAYGTPALITVDLGLLIELPAPLRIVIVGVVKALLPAEDEALIDVRVNFLGVIDFDKGELSFDASLFDSRLLAYDLSGDMAVRVRWKGSKVFVLSVGGFHPAFQPPPLNLPQLRRLTLQLLDGDNPRLRLETYLAVTSNTVQFGARAELHASAGSFNAYGFIAFDVLFQFGPFHFIAEVKAMIALRAGSRTIASISLSLTLEGPTPWKAKGTASLKLFWFLTVKVRFSRTWGEQRGTLFPDTAVLPLLVAALANPANWRSELPSERHLLVSLRRVASVTDAIVVHPLGGLAISQKVVPLNVPITKFGNSRPSDHHEFSIANVRASGEALASTDVAAAQEDFAPAQFFDKSDAEKLSAESFVQFPGGIALGVSQELASSHYVREEVDYELKYRDSQRERTGAGRPGRGTFHVDPVAFSAWAQNGAVARSPLSFAVTGVAATAPRPVQIAQERFAVAHLSDLRLAVSDAEAGSETEALALMTRLIATRPDLAGRLHVVPSYEVNREAA
jgi:hypothetical protein